MATVESNRLVLNIKVPYPDGSRTATARRVFSVTADGGLLVETSGAVLNADGSKMDRTGTWLYKRAGEESASRSHCSVYPDRTAVRHAGLRRQPLQRLHNRRRVIIGVQPRRRSTRMWRQARKQ